jgi:HSP20 family protein
MSLVLKHPTFPGISRDNFLTPFDRLFDTMFESNFPEIVDTVGVRPFEGTAYPKVNVYEHEDKVGVVAEIPGISKEDLAVDVEDNVLTIKGSKHGAIGRAMEENATVLRRELKHSSFERRFTLGESLDGDNIKARFKDGILSIDIPKTEIKEPKKSFVKIS